jgi:hypothetical protein
MAILKYMYLSLGIILYIIFNFVSYTNANYAGDIFTKLMFSTLSFIFLILCYALILFPETITKKAFSQFPTHLKVMLYVGIVISPMMSLYYTT